MPLDLTAETAEQRSARAELASAWRDVEAAHLAVDAALKKLSTAMARNFRVYIDRLICDDAGRPA